MHLSLSWGTRSWPGRRLKSSLPKSLLTGLGRHYRCTIVRNWRGRVRGNGSGRESTPYIAFGSGVQIQLLLNSAIEKKRQSIQCPEGCGQQVTMGGKGRCVDTRRSGEESKARLRNCVQSAERRSASTVHDFVLFSSSNLLWLQVMKRVYYVVERFLFMELKRDKECATLLH